MTTLSIHTDMLSPYGWTARLVAAEKGVAYDVVAVDLTASAHAKLHPFGKMPVLVHGEVIIYETMAIAHYLDAMFDGPPLQPVDALGQTMMLQWISAVNGYIFPVMNRLVKERMGAPMQGVVADEAVIQGLVPQLVHHVSVIEGSLGAHPFLTGAAMTLADCFIYPHLKYVSFTPEGAVALASAPATHAWLTAMDSRSAVQGTNPLFIG